MEKKVIIETTSSARLQVLIVTCGRQGIIDVSQGEHPAVDGVEYLVGWQTGDPYAPVPDALRRSDFRIMRHDSIGVAANRQFLLEQASAPVVILSDDDLSYTVQGLRAIMEAFDDNPGCDLISFQYACGVWKKHYPQAYAFDLRRPARGWYLTAFELAFRTSSVKKAGIRFNPHFGVGAPLFPACEEDLFLHDALKAGLRGMYLGIEICRHRDEPTTGIRQRDSEAFIRTKGAVFTRLYPFTWPLRMLRHAVSQKEMSLRSYIHHWLTGIKLSRRLRVFQ